MVAITRSGRAKASTPQPSVMVGIVAGIDAGVVCHHGQRRLLGRMLGQAVARRLPAAVDAVGEKGEVVARAVVAQPLLGGAERVREARSRRARRPRRPRSSASTWMSWPACDAHITASTRSSRPRRVEAARGDQRLGLERLGRRAQGGHAVGIAAAGDDRPVRAHGDRVDAVVALGEAVSVGGDDAGLGQGTPTLPNGM